MASEDFRQNPQNHEPQLPNQAASGNSRFEEFLEQEQQDQYNKHYQRIAEVLEKGTPDFRLIAKETGLKERRVRDTLLFRLTTGAMIQLFGQKIGICYVCNNRMRDNLTQEPLCLPCIDTIGNKIKELYPPEIELVAPASNDVCISESKVATTPPPQGMVTQEQYDLLLSEVTRYRAKYGPIESCEDEKPPDKEIIPEPETQVESELTDLPPSEMADSAPTSDAFDILHIEEGPEDKEYQLLEAVDAQSATEPLRHFGFQRLRSRN